MSTSDFIKSLLGQREWQTFECKRAAAKPGRLLESIVAFANTEGGVIALGLEDPDKANELDRLYGISENPANVSDLFNLASKEIDPPLPHLRRFEADIRNRDGQEDKIILLTVGKSNDVHSLKNGDTFVRNGARNDKIGSSQIIRLKYEKGVIKFESESSGINDFEVIDRDLLAKYKKESGSQSQDDWQFLKDNGLALSRNDQWELTKGGILLFSKNPAVTLSSKCSVKITHYHGTAPTFSEKPNFLKRPFSIEGPLLDQITKTVDYFREVVRSSPPKLMGGTFKPSLLVPEWVFQEAIANAVIHRDYSIQDDTHVRFFDDRIEVESPGTYPGHITVSNIRQERFARNPIILRTLNRFTESPNLDHGEGVDRMYSIMRSHNLYEPIYFPPKVRPHSVLLLLINLQRIEYWDTVSQYLDKHGQIGNEQARRITGIEDTLKMSKMLRLWVEKGLLIKHEVSGKRSTVYSKAGTISFEPLFSMGPDNES